MENSISIYEILQQMQKDLKVPKAEFNSFGRFNYRKVEQILEAIKAISPPGVLVTLNDEIVMVGERYYIKATASLRYNNEVITTSAFAREPLDKKGMDEAQISGTCSSYSRKYALSGLFLLDDSKPDPDIILDPDAHDQRNYKPAAKPIQAYEVKPTEPMVQKSQLERLRALMGEDKEIEHRVCAWLITKGILTLEDLSINQLTFLIINAEDKLAQANKTFTTNEGETP